MPKIGLVSRSWPNDRGHRGDTKTAKPRTRAATPNGRESTTAPATAGAGRPLVAASYRGVRQATARTVKLTVSAATAPAMASSGGIGRSFGPPIPWARMSSQDGSSDPLTRLRAGRSTFSRSCDSTSTTPGLSMVSAAGWWCPRRTRAPARGWSARGSRRGSSASTTSSIGWPTCDLDPLAVGRHGVALEGDLDGLGGQVGPVVRSRWLVVAAAGQADGATTRVRTASGTPHQVGLRSPWALRRAVCTIVTDDAARASDDLCQNPTSAKRARMRGSGSR